MKRIIATITLAAALTSGAGCAHKQLTNDQVGRYAVTGGTVVLLVGLLVAGVAKGREAPATTNALPPQ